MTKKEELKRELIRLNLLLDNNYNKGMGVIYALCIRKDNIKRMLGGRI